MDEQFATNVAMLSFVWRIDLEFSSNCSMARIVKCFRPCPVWLGLALRVRVRVRFSLGLWVMRWENYPIDAQAHHSNNCKLL